MEKKRLAELSLVPFMFKWILKKVAFVFLLPILIYHLLAKILCRWLPILTSPILLCSRLQRRPAPENAWDVFAHFPSYLGRCRIIEHKTQNPFISRSNTRRLKAPASVPYKQKILHFYCFLFQSIRLQWTTSPGIFIVDDWMKIGSSLIWKSTGIPFGGWFSALI